MQPDFQPLFRNPHVATIAGNFWSRPSRELRSFERKHYQVNQETAIVSYEGSPQGSPLAHVVFLHGLEGSAHAGYIQSFAAMALSKGFAVHSLNLRTCGGTERLSSTMYHSGLTSDTAFVISAITKRTPLPVFLVGFSLGGNVALKLAGEFGARSPLRGVISVSAPIDLAVCVHAIDQPANRLYARRFVQRLKARIRRKSELSAGHYQTQYLHSIRSIWAFDDRYTAPLFGFGTAANYYATQSALNYVGQIQTRALVIAAQDDPLVPFDIYRHPDLCRNKHIEILSPKYGGHLGFLSRRKPRFWLDEVGIRWIQSRMGE